MGKPSRRRLSKSDSAQSSGYTHVTWLVLSVIRRIQSERKVSHLPRRVQQNKTRQVVTHADVDGKTVVFSHC